MKIAIAIACLALCLAGCASWSKQPTIGGYTVGISICCIGY
ncbi:hypothetical protein [Paraburkholderia fungorum]